MSREHEFAKSAIYPAYFHSKIIQLKKESNKLSFKLLSLSGKININTSKKLKTLFIIFPRFISPKFDFSISLRHPDVYAEEASSPRINTGLNTNSLEQDV
jgi:hypothetical protein